MQVEKQSKAQPRRHALTLVELLVTITIMGLVIAISIPMVKPMLASNKVKSGADIVAGFLAQSRNRAIEEGRPVGVTFERVLNYGDDVTFPYNGACVLMRQVAEPKPLSGFVKDVRVALEPVKNLTGDIILYYQIVFYAWNTTMGSWDSTSGASEAQYWNKLIQDTGDQIQFDAKGPKYELAKASATDYRIDMNTDANRNFAPPPTVHPALFKVFRKPQPGKVAPTMAVPVAMPEGIVVDLDCSGIGSSNGKQYYDIKTQPVTDSSLPCFFARDDFCALDTEDHTSVTIMFSPTGEVDRVYYNDKPSNPGASGVIPSEPIFLCIGVWERTGFWEGDAISDDYLPEENIKIRNYHDLNNYWVTIFPRTGAIRVNRVASTPDHYASLGNAMPVSRRLADSLHGAETR